MTTNLEQAARECAARCNIALYEVICSTNERMTVDVLTPIILDALRGVAAEPVPCEVISALIVELEGRATENRENALNACHDDRKFMRGEAAGFDYAANQLRLLLSAKQPALPCKHEWPVLGWKDVPLYLPRTSTLSESMPVYGPCTKCGLVR